jgi:archaetidylinositol phosphate synthase
MSNELPHNSWTHRLARHAMRPLAATAVTPSNVTTARLLTGLVACGAFAMGTREAILWGGGWWVFSAFLDRADGELARLTGKMSAAGHHYDYVCDVVINGLVFVAIGIGLRHSLPALAAISLGVLAGVSVSAASILSEAIEERLAAGEKAYAGRGGFDFDDILYLFGPIAWFGALKALLIGAAIGGPAFCLWTFVRYRKLQ